MPAANPHSVNEKGFTVDEVGAILTGWPDFQASERFKKFGCHRTRDVPMFLQRLDIGGHVEMSIGVPASKLQSGNRCRIQSGGEIRRYTTH